jgi:transcriptional regulator with XRE-family HTH domain
MISNRNLGGANMNDITFGDKLREVRKAKKLTQKQLAGKLNKVESTVRMWELGKNKPSIESIQNIADVLEADCYELLTLAGHTNLLKEIEVHTKILSDTKMMIDKITERKNKKRLVSFEIPSSVFESDENNPYSYFEKSLTKEEAKKHFLQLEYLLTMKEKVYFNKRELDLHEREKALRLLNIAFDKDQISLDDLSAVLNLQGVKSSGNDFIEFLQKEDVNFFGHSLSDDEKNKMISFMYELLKEHVPNEVDNILKRLVKKN